MSSGVSLSPDAERPLLLLIIAIGVMLLLAAAMLSAARLYLGDAAITEAAPSVERNGVFPLGLERRTEPD